MLSKREKNRGKNDGGILRIAHGKEMLETTSCWWIWAHELSLLCTNFWCHKKADTVNGIWYSYQQKVFEVWCSLAMILTSL